MVCHTEYDICLYANHADSEPCSLSSPLGVSAPARKPQGGQTLCLQGIPESSPLPDSPILGVPRCAALQHVPWLAGGESQVAACM